MKRQKTQVELIMKHLQSGKSINSLQALEKFGCFRLAAVIFILKDKHQMKIEKKMSDVKGVRFATYKMVK